MLQYFASFVVSIAVSTLLTWGVRTLALKFGLAAGPRSARHIHTQPIPRLGGVAVFIAFVVVFALYFWAASRGFVAGPANRDLLFIVVAAGALFVAGLIDDLRSLNATTKLMVEIGGAVWLYASGIRFSLPGHSLDSGLESALSLIVTVLWVLLVCNAINLIDGLDGLAAGAALFSMVTIFSLAMGTRPGVATATAILAGSVFGFLIFNFNPASIFLGDSGSLFVGFLLSGFVLAESQKQQSPLDTIFIPLVSFALPLTDVGVSVFRRFVSGHALFGADREHIHHKLLELGLTQRQVVWILYGISAVFSVLSLFLLHPSDVVLVPVTAIIGLILFFGLRKLHYHEFGELTRLWNKVAQHKHALEHNIAVRKAAARLEGTADPRAIVKVLESCLRDDFDGFSINLSDRFAAGNFSDAPWRNNSVSISWNRNPEQVVLILELGSPQSRFIGKFALFQSLGRQMLIDPELLKGQLRTSLVKALQNVAEPQLMPVVIPALQHPQPHLSAALFDREVQN